MAEVAETGADVPARRRLFISGIAPTLTKEELVSRLKTYGTLAQDLDLNRKNEGTTGVFAYCDLELTATSWARLRKLSGTVLKGRKLRIEDAKPDWTARKEAAAKRPATKVPNSRRRPPVDTIPAVESKRVKRGEVVKDSSITQKSRSKGWIKGRYGRALAILKIDGKPPLKRNPDALSKLWGTAHPRPDQLTAWYDDEEDEWHDRRGRIIKETEITKKLHNVDTSNGQRVEVWGSDDEDEKTREARDTDAYTTASSLQPDYDGSATTTEVIQPVDEEAIAAQLAAERSTALSMLGEMFKGSDAIEEAAQERKEQRKTRDKLDIVKRFDPMAPESDSEDESMNDSDNIHADKETPAHAVTATGPQPRQGDDDATSTLQSNADEDTELSDDEPVPAFLKTKQDQVNTEDLTSIFRPSIHGNNAPFSLFDSGDLESEDDEDASTQRSTEAVAQEIDQNIHPDRLNLSSLPASSHEHELEGNANYTALTKDRGFSMSTFSNAGVFPLFFSEGPDSIWHGESNFFGPSINVDDVKRRWEESRGEVTRDWKRKRKEGEKMRRKAAARQGR